MTGIPDDVWLFTRGGQSVRLVRHVNMHGGCVLVVRGPGAEVETYEFTDVSLA